MRLHRPLSHHSQVIKYQSLHHPPPLAPPSHLHQCWDPCLQCSLHLLRTFCHLHSLHNHLSLSHQLVLPSNPCGSGKLVQHQNHLTLNPCPTPPQPLCLPQTS